MNINRHLLRKFARQALIMRGDIVTITPHPGAGIAPEVRLTAVRGAAAPRSVCIRTSANRLVGLVRDKKGHWRTIPEVDEVLIAAPTDDKTAIEVMSFDPKVLINIFDNALKQRPHLTNDYRLPVFMPLDKKRLKRTGAIVPGLKDKSEWCETINLNEKIIGRDIEKFNARVEEIKREFAEINAVDVGKVAIEFRIIY